MQRKRNYDQHILYPSKPSIITTGEKNMSQERTRIDVTKAIETSYWFGMVDGIRDTYRMVFKEPKGTDKLNTTLSETLDRVMEQANLEQKNMHQEFSSLLVFYLVQGMPMERFMKMSVQNGWLELKKIRQLSLKIQENPRK